MLSQDDRDRIRFFLVCGRRGDALEVYRQACGGEIHDAELFFREVEGQLPRPQVGSSSPSPVDYKLLYGGPVPSTSNANAGLLFVSFLFPIVGLILGAVLISQDKPRQKDAGRSYFTAAIIGIVLGLVSIFSVLYYLANQR